MPPCDGDAGLKSETESTENNGDQSKAPRRTLNSGMWTTPPLKKLGTKPAYLSSKESAERKGLLAVISDGLDQRIKQYCCEKNSLYNTLMVSRVGYNAFWINA